MRCERPLLVDDVTWTNIGSTRFSGTYNGKQAIVEDLLGLLFGQLRAGISSEIERLTAEGDICVAQTSGTAETVDGTPYDNTYCQVIGLSSTDDEHRLLNELTNLAATVEQYRASTNYRFAATRAYHSFVTLESQNQKLLAEMNRRGQLQLRLQQTVEGLSVAAISYYMVGLAKYGLEKRGISTQEPPPEQK